jgi:hypothetical protein
MLAMLMLLVMPNASSAQTSSAGQDAASQFDGAPLAMPPVHELIRTPRLEYQGVPAPPSSTHVRSHTNPVHPLPHLIHQRTSPASSAVIPGVPQREVWKTPFSYGYFGASGSRHWIRHYGYRDRDKEWRLR